MGVIRNRKSKKDRQENEQKKKDKQLSTKHTNKTIHRVTRTPLKTRGELRCPGRVLILLLSTTFLWDIRNIATVWYVLFFILLLIVDDIHVVIYDKLIGIQFKKWLW